MPGLPAMASESEQSLLDVQRVGFEKTPTVLDGGSISTKEDAMGNAWQAKRNQRKKTDLINGLTNAAMNDPVFTQAVEFDEGSVELMVNESWICRKDGKPLECIRGVNLSLWEGFQAQLVCPSCPTKYVQFFPFGEREN